MDEVEYLMLEIKSINRLYKYKKGICNLSLSVNKEEIVCFVGPNGSGKSTSVKIIAGIIDAHLENGK